MLLKLEITRPFIACIINATKFIQPIIRYARAVAEIFSKQRKIKHMSAIVAVHSLPENGNDYQGLQAVCVKIGYKANIINCVRIGKASGKTRMLKV